MSTLDTLFRLDGKVALVTGARTGIGRAAAEVLAAAGADIVGAGSQPMPETAASIAATGRRFAAIEADLGQREVAKGLVGRAIEALGQVDIVVNNAGIIRRADLPDYPEGDWDRVTSIDLDAVFFVSQAAATHMLARKAPGRIINIASILGFQGGIRVPAYTAAKHGVIGITRAMANELAPQGITVNALAPGYVETDNTSALRADPVRARAILDRTPVGRWGVPTDLATAVLFLAAPASGFVTGSVVTVDGGWMAR
jgi:2-dehydro-3-deoxy-D-gluconate 5-dehydrogenase